jgi:hypothetical protein
MTVNVWPDKRTRDAFFTELRLLVDRYPNLADHMSRDYADDPTDEHWGDENEDYAKYDPKSPMFLQGIVLVISHTNMEHYEDLTVLDPYEQSSYMTKGILSAASVMFDSSTD